MAVFGFVKFQLCLKEVNISFEPEFGKPRFETPGKLNVGNFQLTYFSAIVDFIIWYLLYKPQQRKLEFYIYFSVISFLCLAAKEVFETQLLKTRGLTLSDFEKNPKIHFKPGKSHF